MSNESSSEGGGAESVCHANVGASAASLVHISHMRYEMGGVYHYVTPSDARRPYSRSLLQLGTVYDQS